MKKESPRNAFLTLCTVIFAAVASMALKWRSRSPAPLLWDASDPDSPDETAAAEGLTHRSREIGKRQHQFTEVFPGEKSRRPYRPLQSC